jgi:hypothetical protein
MKIQLDEDIHISPKIVLINRFTDLIDENMIINFLINNILLLEFRSFDKIKNKQDNIIGCLVNLDEYLFNINNLNNNILNKINEVIKNIKSLKDFYIATFTIYNVNKIKEKFINEGIKYFVRIKNTKDEMVNIIKESLTSVDKEKCNRSSLRIGFMKHQYSVVIKFRENIYRGYIKDLSLKGLGVEIVNKGDFKQLQIGSFVSANIDFGVLYFNIQSGVIVRKDNNTQCIGIKFDITDKYELDDENRTILDSIIRTWLIKAIRSKTMNISNKELFFSEK